MSSLTYTKPLRTGAIHGTIWWNRRTTDGLMEAGFNVHLFTSRHRVNGILVLCVFVGSVRSGHYA